MSIQEKGGGKVYFEGIKNFERTVRARENKGLLTANVKIDAYAVQYIKWLPGEKETLLRRVEEACREVRDWLAEQLQVDEIDCKPDA